MARTKTKGASLVIWMLSTVFAYGRRILRLCSALGQMSYWAANVILSLFGAIPFIGPDLQVWIQGDFVLSELLFQDSLHYMLWLCLS